MTTLTQEPGQSDSPAKRSQPTVEPPFEYGSNPLRLSGKDWLAVAVLFVGACLVVIRGWPGLETIGGYERQGSPSEISPSGISSPRSEGSPATPNVAETLVHRVERFGPVDYRVPYRLSSDFWTYSHWCEAAAAKYPVLVVGDSTIWGHYVDSHDTLSHCLNHIAHEDRYANLGLSGLHDMALFGLLKDYGKVIAGKKVLLHFDPLWMHSEESDLQGEKEFHFQYEELAPQFWPSLKCYRADVETRLTRYVGQHLPLTSFTTHLLACYFDNTNIPEWMMSHPYEGPWRPVTFDVPWSGEAEDAGVVWSTKIKKPKDYPWIMPADSLQWRFFRETVASFRSRNNEVFVLVGPFNPYTLTPESLRRYRLLVGQVEEWLGANDVPHFLVPDLPSDEYGDVSHPLKQGYVRIAEGLSNDPIFKAWSN
jgi:hypothetical protein